jgi:hypothetical protein
MLPGSISMAIARAAGRYDACSVARVDLSATEITAMRATRASLIVPFAIAIACVAGCGASPGAPSTQASQAQASTEVTRAVAIHTARSDAAMRFQNTGNAHIAAHRLGAFWVVELRGPSGAGLRYAISVHDGSIRQRNVFQ